MSSANARTFGFRVRHIIAGIVGLSSVSVLWNCPDTRPVVLNLARRLETYHPRTVHNPRVIDKPVRERANRLVFKSDAAYPAALSNWTQP